MARLKRASALATRPTALRCAVPKKKAQPVVEPAKTWCLYVLRCSDGTLYCGITNDLPKRIAQHDLGKGARYTRGRGPVLLLRSWPHDSKSAALKAEIAFKRLSRPAKEAILAA